MKKKKSATFFCLHIKKNKARSSSLSLLKMEGWIKLRRSSTPLFFHQIIKHKGSERGSSTVLKLDVCLHDYFFKISQVVGPVEKDTQFWVLMNAAKDRFFPPSSRFLKNMKYWSPARPAGDPRSLWFLWAFDSGIRYLCGADTRETARLTRGDRPRTSATANPVKCGTMKARFSSTIIYCTLHKYTQLFYNHSIHSNLT